MIKNTFGFTLLETVIASGVALVVGTFLITILVNNNGFFYKQAANISLGLSLNDSLNLIDNYLKEAVQVEAQYPESSPIYTSSGTTLILKVPALGSNSILENVYDFVVVQKDPQSDILRLKVFPNIESIRSSKDIVLTTLLKETNFSYLDKDSNPVTPILAGKVRVNLTVSSGTVSDVSVKSSMIEINLRNK